MGLVARGSKSEQKSYLQCGATHTNLVPKIYSFFWAAGLSPFLTQTASHSHRQVACTSSDPPRATDFWVRSTGDAIAVNFQSPVHKTNAKRSAIMYFLFYSSVVVVYFK